MIGCSGQRGPDACYLIIPFHRVHHNSSVLNKTDSTQCAL